MFDLHTFYRAEMIANEGKFRQLGFCSTTEPFSLVYCVDLNYLRQAENNENVSVIITTAELAQSIHSGHERGVVISSTPREVYWSLHNQLCCEGLLAMDIGEQHIGSHCSIHPTAVVAEKVFIADHVTIGAGVVIEDNTIIGAGTEIAPGVVISTQGLQTYRQNGKQKFIAHAGGVKIGENVVILANSAISRSVFPIFTEVGDSTVISLLSSIGHQAKIGNNCSLAGNVLVGGSVTMGDNVWIGPSATIKDGIKIGANAQIKLGSVVVKDVTAGEVVSGNFALPHSINLRAHARKLR